jgi:purine-nucleoside phosphorylase
VLGQVAYGELEAIFGKASHPKIKGHPGVLKICRMPGKQKRDDSLAATVLVLQGRLHSYDGFAAQEVALPVRLLYRLGVGNLIVTNAAGGINAKMRPGTLMLISDHIHFMQESPLRGKNLDQFGPRFPDLTYAYDPALRAVAIRLARRLRIALKEGVYVAVPGPQYETPAEIRMLKKFGADAVGMSTTSEVIVANHQGMRVLGLSLIANQAAGLGKRRLDHDDVVKAGERGSKDLGRLLFELLRSMR